MTTDSGVSPTDGPVLAARPSLHLAMCPKPSQSNVVLVMLEIATQGDAPVDRFPIDLAVALDRSSSMVGARVATAIEAVREIALRLSERDSLAVVAFDQRAAVVRPPGPVTADVPHQLTLDLTRFGLGYGTNLQAGYTLALEQLTRRESPGASKTLLLLTDGHPTVGPRQVAEIVPHVKAGRERGVVTTTVGIGQGFREDLLVEMARVGEGVFRYIRYDQDLVQVAEEETIGLKGLLADRVELRLSLAEHVQRYEVLHDLSTDLEGTDVVLNLGRLFIGSERRILVEVAGDPARGPLGRATLSFRTDAAPHGGILSAEIAPSDGDGLTSVGSAYVPLRVARGLARLWERSLDLELDDVLELIQRLEAELMALPAPMREGPEAKDCLERFHAICDRIRTEGLSRNTSLGIAELHASTTTGRNVPRGWGRR